MRKDLFPAFVDSIQPCDFPVPPIETVLSTQSIIQNGRSVLKCVASVVDHAKELAGLLASDFDIKTQIETGQIENLRPAAVIKLSPLEQYDVMSEAATVLMSKADLDIIQSMNPQEPVPDPVTKPASKPASESASEPAPEPNK